MTGGASGELRIVSAEQAEVYLGQAAQLLRVITAERRTMSPDGFAEPLAQLPDVEVLLKRLHDLKEEGALFYVALFNADFAGFLVGRIEDYEDDLLGSNYMNLTYLAVMPQYRGQGVAHQLICVLEQSALELGITALELCVQSQNHAAIAAYERYGFVPLEVRYARLLNSLVAAEQASA